MDPLSIEKAMIKNMIEKTGKSIDEWFEVVINKKFNKHSEIVDFLKSEYYMTHGNANLVARESKTQ
tara:strand:+ start:426 stop:623 length:198 start_codon:yes stop_codon:yes gene_type:complete